MGAQFMTNIVTRDEAKRHLRVTHTEDDTFIDECIERAEQRVEDFCGVNYAAITSSSSSETLTAALKLGTLLFVQAQYDATPEQMEVLEKAARRVIAPYRTNLGI